MTKLSIEVTATDPAEHTFTPQMLMVSIGTPDIGNDTCDVSFELRDNTEFNPQLYISREKIIRGVMRVPLSLLTSLVNQDGTFNTAAFNAVLINSYLQVSETTNPIQAI